MLRSLKEMWREGEYVTAFAFVVMFVLITIAVGGVFVNLVQCFL